jgi:hypothetical protein
MSLRSRRISFQFARSAKTEVVAIGEFKFGPRLRELGVDAIVEQMRRLQPQPAALSRSAQIGGAPQAIAQTIQRALMNATASMRCGASCESASAGPWIS